MLANLPVAIKPEIKIEDDSTAILGTQLEQIIAAKLQTYSEKESCTWLAVGEAVSRWNDTKCPYYTDLTGEYGLDRRVISNIASYKDLNALEGCHFCGTEKKE